jgi:gamma-glutamyltranspeptidase/glutathione hydrolase
MVASAHPLATDAGAGVLAAGGNAFDAAVATAAVLNVVEPMMSGIGGYGTILVYSDAENRVRYLDSSGRIPRSLDPESFRPPHPDYLENRRGPKAVSTPGNVNAWSEMSKTYGRLPWKDLLRPAIRIAREGFPIGARLARSIEGAFPEFPEHARLIFGREGRPLRAGETLIQARLAESFGLLAESGADAFYRGSLGKAIDEEMRRSGGFLSLQDLEQDSAEWWEPISIIFRGHRVFTASPPATAFPSLIRLGIMSCFEPGSAAHNSAAYLHRFAETTKIAFWCRLAYAGDPDIHPPPLERLLSEAFWRDKANQIDPERAAAFVPPGAHIRQGPHTTHFVTADQWGNIVSATQTLGNAFGSRIMPRETGFWLNNSLAYCTFEPAGNPMDAHPGQRKLSGDCPTIIFRDGRPWAALGTPGGHTIGQTVPQMVINLLEFGMDIRRAVSAPRISFAEPDRLLVEADIPDGIREELQALGHNIRVVTALGLAHALTVSYDEKGRPAGFLGAADPRGEGSARGY